MTPAETALAVSSSSQRHGDLAGQPASRFRHTFGSDMIRAGVESPRVDASHGSCSYPYPLLRYIQLTPQDVFAEYARAVERIGKPAQPELS